MDIYTAESWNTLRVMVFNGVWVLGAAINLAVIAFIIYELRISSATLKELASAPKYTQRILTGTLLIMIGAALTTSATWQVILYSVCAVLILIQRIAENSRPEKPNGNEN